VAQLDAEPATPQVPATVEHRRALNRRVGEANRWRLALARRHGRERVDLLAVDSIFQHRVTGEQSRASDPPLRERPEGGWQLVGYGVSVMQGRSVARIARVIRRGERRVRAAKLAPGATRRLRAPRARGAGRPATRAARRGGDSGDSDPDEPEPGPDPGADLELRTAPAAWLLEGGEVAA
jgi:hypothetical protein